MLGLRIQRAAGGAGPRALHAPASGRCSLAARAPARSLSASAFLGRQGLALSASAHLTGGGLLYSPGSLLQRTGRSRSALVVEANSKTGLDQTKRGTRRRRTRTSGFRARMETPTGRRVLAARRRKGRKVLCPANCDQPNGKKRRSF